MPEPKKEPRIRDLDPRSLRGLAHPLRMQLLDALRRFGPATASQLADRLGESSGATSYHLRQLAAHGFVEDDPERNKGRERWWRAAHEGTRSGPDLLYNPDPVVRGQVNSLMHMVAEHHTRELSTFMGRFHDVPEAWHGASNISDWQMRLTPELAREMNEKLTEIIEAYKALAVEGPDASPYRVHLHAFPRDDEENST
ncbi:ArsR/SmtB family transcription factor [Streptomyces indicus]|uniref:Helix-turn-helix domain-containing protein n=1 Tax=Streptomyces indicus TaxID=417292 RepID=A0A1G9DWM7_9ACTN|nr:metalloregulator ArsR/SmtB family transcription factor [Streptomyces indicus]SDK68230.1 Helix-turn-helix domain-containing protein [Streptomyces indicus]